MMPPSASSTTFILSASLLVFVLMLLSTLESMPPGLRAKLGSFPFPLFIVIISPAIIRVFATNFNLG